MSLFNTNISNYRPNIELINSRSTNLILFNKRLVLRIKKDICEKIANIL